MTRSAYYITFEASTKVLSYDANWFVAAKFVSRGGGGEVIPP